MKKSPERSGFNRLRTLGTAGVAALAGAVGAVGSARAGTLSVSDSRTIMRNSQQFYTFDLDNNVDASYNTADGASYKGSGFAIDDMALYTGDLVTTTSTDGYWSVTSSGTNTWTTTNTFTTLSCWLTGSSSSSWTTCVTSTYPNTSTTTTQWTSGTRVVTTTRTNQAPEFNYGDAFDGALMLAVDRTLFRNPDGDVDYSGGTVTSDVMENIAKNVDAQVQYHFFKDRAVVRALYAVTNTGSSSRTVVVSVGGNLGSDNDTMIQATSSGNLSIENSDLWVVSNEQDKGVSPSNGDGDPTITLTRHGEGAPVKAVVLARHGAEDSDDYDEDFANAYQVTIPAGETVRVMVFAELNVKIKDAEAGAADFETLDALEAAGLLDGMSDAEIASVANYLQPNAAPVAASDDDDDFLGTFSFSLLGVLGLLAVRRRRH